MSYDVQSAENLLTSAHFLFAMQWSALRPPNLPPNFFIDKFHRCVVFLGPPHSSNTTNYLKTPTRVHVQVFCCGIFHSWLDFLFLAKENNIAQSTVFGWHWLIDWMNEFDLRSAEICRATRSASSETKYYSLSLAKLLEIFACWVSFLIIFLFCFFILFFINFIFFVFLFLFFFKLLFFFFIFFLFFFLFIFFFYFFLFFSVGKIRVDKQKASKKWTDSSLLY